MTNNEATDMTSIRDRDGLLCKGQCPLQKIVGGTLLALALSISCYAYDTYETLSPQAFQWDI